MPVYRGKAKVMTQLHHLPETAIVVPCPLHNTIGRGIHRGTNAGAQIGPAMQFHFPQYRVLSHTVEARDFGLFQRVATGNGGEHIALFLRCLACEIGRAHV